MERRVENVNVCTQTYTRALNMYECDERMHKLLMASWKKKPVVLRFAEQRKQSAMDTLQ